MVLARLEYSLSGKTSGLDNVRTLTQNTQRDSILRSNTIPIKIYIEKQECSISRTLSVSYDYRLSLGETQHLSEAADWKMAGDQGWWPSSRKLAFESVTTPRRLITRTAFASHGNPQIQQATTRGSVASLSTIVNAIFPHP